MATALAGRRRLLRLCCLAGAWPVATGLGLLAAPDAAQAGSQVEEPLVDAVRTALSAAIARQAPPVPDFASTEARLHYLRWLAAMSERLKAKKPEWPVRKEFLQTVWYESKRAGLDPSLVLGLVQVESNFRKFAVSSAGARGYMQVMPFWTRLIGDNDAGKLFQLQTNLRFGCVILRHYLEVERGDLFLALGRYNGSRGKAAYPNAVLSAKRQWAHAEAPPLRAEDRAPAAGPARAVANAL